MLKRDMSRFSVEFFRLAVPNYFVAETFCAVFQNFWWRKSLWNRRGGGGEYQDFPSKIFCLSAEIFRRESLVCFRNFRVSEHFLRKRGLSRFPKENLLSHRTEKLRRANLLFNKISGIEKVYG